MTYKTPDERAAYAKRWRAANPEKVKAQEAKRVRDPAKAVERMRRWRAANPEKVKAQQAKNKEWVENNKDRVRENYRRHRAENIEHYRAYNATWHRENRANNPQKVRAMHLLSLYGWTQEMVDSTVLNQGGCGICGTHIPGGRTGQWNVDHNHSTGTVRGILCHACNMGGGQFKDNPTILQKAVEWFSKS